MSSTEDSATLTNDDLWANTQAKTWDAWLEQLKDGAKNMLPFRVFVSRLALALTMYDEPLLDALDFCRRYDCIEEDSGIREAIITNDWPRPRNSFERSAKREIDAMGVSTYKYVDTLIQ